MAGSNKTSLQRRCADAGLSTEGTKKDLLARLSMYNSVGTVEAIIYKEAVQVPQNGESSKGQCCGQEIARELQSAIPGQSATGSARWGNPAGLVVLERTDTYNELLDTNKKLLNKAKEQDDRLASVEASLEATKTRLEATHAHSLAIRNRFFSSFLRDHHPDKYTPGEDKTAHHGAPLIDSYLYTDGIRSDKNTFMILYGLRPEQISLLRDKDAMKVLEYHATVVSNIDEVPRDFEEAFLNFIRAIEAGGFYNGFLEESKQPETNLYWRFMQIHSSLQLKLYFSQEGYFILVPS